MIKKIILFVVVIALFSNELYCQIDKDNLFENLKVKYSTLNSLSLNFTLNDNNIVKGQLIAKKGNKYVLSLGNRKIICNGKDIWNYVPENKNVLLSNYETHGESASIEKILFQFTKNYKPVSLKKISQSGRSSSVFLELMPVKPDNDDISMIKLELNPETIEIFTIIIRRNYAEESWAISNLKLNPNIADNKFEFKTPENVEIIDLR